MNQETEFQALHNGLMNPNTIYVKPFAILFGFLLIAVLSNDRYIYILAGQLLIWISFIDFLNVKNALSNYYSKKAYIQFALEQERSYVGWENFQSIKEEFKTKIDPTLYKKVLTKEYPKGLLYKKHRLASDLSIAYILNFLIGTILTISVFSMLSGSKSSSLLFLQCICFFSTLIGFFSFVVNHEPGLNNSFRFLPEEQKVLTRHVLQYHDDPNHIEVLKEAYETKK